ncbi:histidine phosphatase superfamily branch 1 protein [Nitzschia inconspicua]|uniref:Histidine phosphatase superfamily branch 1 protein n=1 Tax=Nitzschia inconspicua TaxID=303405 RepID=A0A9K3KHT1_9STRA|nr:histidine phosphatase superfamily branch 1 protein [Nitzschia inconspicua]
MKQHWNRGFHNNIFLAAGFSTLFSSHSIARMTASGACAGAADATANAHPTSSSSSSKLLYIVRHGQALHNPRAEAAKASGCTMEEFFELMKQDDAWDAELTELGREQARRCHHTHFNALLLENKLDLVVSSTLSRAIETAELIYPSTSTTHHIPRISLEQFREINGSLLNGKRRSKSFLRGRFPMWDFDMLESEEDDTWTEDMEAYEAAAERGYQGLAWLLSERKEDIILLVSHGGLLRYTMNTHPAIHMADERSCDHHSHNGKTIDSRFDNCEVRKYRLSWKEAVQDQNKEPIQQKRAIQLTQLDH